MLLRFKLISFVVRDKAELVNLLPGWLTQKNLIMNNRHHTLIWNQYHCLKPKFSECKTYNNIDSGDG